MQVQWISKPSNNNKALSTLYPTCTSSVSFSATPQCYLGSSAFSSSYSLTMGTFLSNSLSISPFGEAGCTWIATRVYVNDSFGVVNCDAKITMEGHHIQISPPSISSISDIVHEFHIEWYGNIHLIPKGISFGLKLTLEITLDLAVACTADPSSTAANAATICAKSSSTTPISVPLPPITVEIKVEYDWKLLALCAAGGITTLFAPADATGIPEAIDAECFILSVYDKVIYPVLHGAYESIEIADYVSVIVNRLGQLGPVWCDDHSKVDFAAVIQSSYPPLDLDPTLFTYEKEKRVVRLARSTVNNWPTAPTFRLTVPDSYMPYNFTYLNLINGCSTTPPQCGANFANMTTAQVASFDGCCALYDASINTLLGAVFIFDATLFQSSYQNRNLTSNEFATELQQTLFSLATQILPSSLGVQDLFITGSSWSSVSYNLYSIVLLSATQNTVISMYGNTTTIKYTGSSSSSLLVVQVFSTWNATNTPTPSPIAGTCGNGIVEDGEQCDIKTSYCINCTLARGWSCQQQPCSYNQFCFDSQQNSNASVPYICDNMVFSVPGLAGASTTSKTTGHINAANTMVHSSIF